MATALITSIKTTNEIVLSYNYAIYGVGKNNKYEFFSKIFFINYIIGIGYLIFLLVYKLRFSSPRPNISHGCWVNAIVMFSISAFSLNKEMNVFAPFPVWLNVYTLCMIGVF